MLLRFFGNRVPIPITAARSGGGPLCISDVAAPQDSATAGPPFEPPYTFRHLPSFEADIKELFRPVPDQSVMLAISGFDLRKFEDVRDNAELIFERIADGSMPCDGSWPPDRLATFRRWTDDGMNP